MGGRGGTGWSGGRGGRGGIQLLLARAGIIGKTSGAGFRQS